MPAYGLVPDSVGGYYAGKILRKSTKRASRGARSVSRPILRSTTTTFSLQYKDVKFYDWALNLELHTPSGGLWKDLERRSAMALFGARAQVGVRTGTLKQSIYSSHTSNKFSQTVKIGSNMSYALLHHQGSRPHMITPKDKNGVLVFKSGAKIVKTSVVAHPGTRPNPYLSSQLRHFRY